MNDRPQIHYLCNSGEVKKRAEAHRERFLALHKGLADFVKLMGATKFSRCDSMMLLRSIHFEGDVPTGWTKKDKHGGSRPKPFKIHAELLKHFTPSGSYMVAQHPDLAAFGNWLGCPGHYEWTKGKNHCGSDTIGLIFADSIVYWYDPTGPICLVLPDVAGAKARANAEGRKVTGDVLDWKPPKGLKEILEEEWDLMEAKHKKATGS